MSLNAIENENDLIRNANAGCQSSMETILKRYKITVNRIVNSYYLIGSDAEDLIQEGMIGLYKALRDYREDRGLHFSMFAKLCIKRQVITAVKTYNRQKHKPLNYYKSIYEPKYNESNTMLIETIPSGLSSIDSVLINNELIGDIEKFIKTDLSKLERSVLVLYLTGLPYKDIASTLMVSYKSVDSSIWRIKKKCRRTNLLKQQ